MSDLFDNTNVSKIPKETKNNYLTVYLRPETNKNIRKLKTTIMRQGYI